MCLKYIHLLSCMAFKGVPFTELIDKINGKLTLLVQSFQNKETFINDMEKFISLEGRQKISHAEIHLKVKTLLESKTWPGKSFVKLGSKML